LIGLNGLKYLKNQLFEISTQWIFLTDKTGRFFSHKQYQKDKTRSRREVLNILKNDVYEVFVRLVSFPNEI